MAPLFTGLKLGGFGKNPDVVSAGSPQVPVNIYLWGGYGGDGRAGTPESGGWVRVSGTATPGTTIGYITGQSNGSRNFYAGGSGTGYSSHGGGFSAVFVGPVTPGNADSYILGLAGGAGGGGNDGFGDARGGYGGGPAGNPAYESPNQGGLAGSGGNQVGGGSAGSGPMPGQSGTKWLGGAGNSGQNTGGGGGGWYGGGGGGSNSSYDAGGGGGSGYVNTGTITQSGFGSFTITTTVNNVGRPAPLGHNNPTPYTSPSGALAPGAVVIEVNGVAVVNTTSSPPGSAVNTYVIP